MRERGFKFSGNWGFCFWAIFLILSVALIATKTDKKVAKQPISTQEIVGKVTEATQTMSGVVVRFRSSESRNGRSGTCSLTLNTREQQITIPMYFTECQKVSEGDSVVLERQKHLHLIEGYKHDSWKPWKVVSPFD